MKRLAGVVIACNEEEKIREALTSLSSVCDEIVVVDSGSSDRTPTVCREFTPRVYAETWRGYRDQKQFATDLAEADWVLSLDADERLSPELQNELRRWKSLDSDPFDGYRIPRVAFFLGRWIRHTTWHPDRQLRLFLRSSGHWVGGRVHERFAVTSGRIGDFRGEIHHLTYSSVQEYLEQLQRFSSLAAQDAYDKGDRAGPAGLLLHPVLAFVRNYLLKRGFLDGYPGLAVSWMAAASTVFRYLKLFEIQSRAESHGGDASGVRRS